MEVKKIYYGPAREIFTPIFDDDSRMVSMEGLKALAVEPVEDAPRFARCVLITRERPARGQWETLPATHFVLPADCPLVFGDTGLPIATIEDAESADDADVGPCLRATAKFFRTRLAEIIYAGVCNEILNGVCCVISWGTHIKTGRAMGLIREIRVGALEDSCLASARIWPIFNRTEKGAKHARRKIARNGKSRERAPASHKSRTEKAAPPGA